MTTLTVRDNTVTVLVKPGEYTFHGVLGVGFGFDFRLDNIAKKHLYDLVTDKKLISPQGEVYALADAFFDVDTLFDQKDIESYAYLLTLGIGRDCSDEEAIVVIQSEEIKDDV